MKNREKRLTRSFTGVSIGVSMLAITGCQSYNGVSFDEPIENNNFTTSQPNKPSVLVPEKIVLPDINQDLRDKMAMRFKVTPSAVIPENQGIMRSYESKTIENIIAEAEPRIQFGEISNIPYGYNEFCNLYVEECQPSDLKEFPVHIMDDETYQTIYDINININYAIQPMSDQDNYGKPELWTLDSNGIGDCEEYVLLKREQLYEAGFDRHNLLITVVQQQDGEGHAVLIVRTDQGDFVLDNLNDKIKKIHEVGYSFKTIQHPSADPKLFVKFTVGLPQPVETVSAPAELRGSVGSSPAIRP